MPNSLTQSRLAGLTIYLDDEALSAAARQQAIERQVRLILRALQDEPEQERGAILDYLRLLGLGNLIMEKP
jgi:hypothetical protein